MNSAEIKSLMCEIPQFDRLKPEELDIVARYMRYQKEASGKRLVTEGTIGNAMFYIASGKVEVEKEGMRGGQAVLARYTKGSTIGEMALLDEGQTRSATAVVLDDSEFLVLSRDNFERLIEENPTVAIKIIRNIASQLSQRLRELSGRFADMFE